MTAIDGGVTTLSYGANNWTVTEPGNRMLTATLDANNNLTGITDVDQTPHTFTYDPLYHHVIRDQWQPLDAAFSYDPSSGLLTTIDRGLGTSYALVAAAAGQLVNANGQTLAEVTDNRTDTPDGHGDSTVWLLDGRGRLLEQDRADGGVETWTRDAHGQVTDQADALYRHTLSSYAYGPGPGAGAGDLTEIDYADGGFDHYTYDPATLFHEIITDTDAALTHSTHATYDPATGDRLSSTDGLNNTTVYAYYQQTNGVSNGLLMSMTDPDHNTTNYQYEPVTRRLSILTDALTNPTTTHYDANGNVSSVLDARGFTTYTTYDNRNRLTQQNPPRVRHGGHGLRCLWRRDGDHRRRGAGDGHHLRPTWLAGGADDGPGHDRRRDHLDWLRPGRQRHFDDGRAQQDEQLRL